MGYLYPIDEKLIAKVLYEKLPEYIENHPQVRNCLERIIQEKCADKKETESRFDKVLNEIKKMREDFERRWQELKEESERKWQELRETDEKLREDFERRWQEMKEESERRWQEMKEESERKWQELKKADQELKQADLELRKEFTKKFESTIGAIGARWGVFAETSFRNAMKGILEEEFPVKVERYLAKDEEGKVFGHPDQVELDLVIRNGKVIAVEIKSSMSKSDVYAFDRKVKFYEEKEKRKVDRKIIISPMIDPRAKPVIEKLGIEAYSFPDQVENLE